MRILLLSDPNSSHTIKWATSLAKLGIDLSIFGIGSLRVDDYRDCRNINVITLAESVDRREGALSKVRYLKAVPLLKRVVRDFDPDILHAHFASSYALLGALSSFHPFVVSVWGSDIFSFPRKSIFHKVILQFNLSTADRVLSTSHVMARETGKYTKKEIIVTPFGVDLNIFKPAKVDSVFSNKDIVVGTVKALEKEYGIEYLIRAFADVRRNNRTLPLRMLIVGGGSLEKFLKDLTRELGVSDVTVFTDRVGYAEVPVYQNMLSVYVSVSESESFGVSVVEACACEKPVVVSNVGGLPEIVQDGVTGFVVPPRDVAKTAEAIERLIHDEKLRQVMGRAGRERVKKLYSWNDTVDLVVNTYEKLLSSRQSN